MHIDIWSDIACPFCYIGKRHLEQALAQFPARDSVELRWHSFELDPNSPREGSRDPLGELMAKYGKSREEVEAMMDHVTQMGAQAGLQLQLHHTVRTNTFDAHRLLHLASEHGLQNDAKERLLKAYFTESAHLGETDTLVRLLGEVGLPEAAVREVLTSDRYGELVRADEQAAREMGIGGVPFFVFNERYAVSGAQPTSVFLEVLNKVQAETPAPLQQVAPAAPGCADESCELPSAG